MRDKAYRLLLELIVDDLQKYTEAHLPEEAVALITDKGCIHPLINQRRSKHQFMVSTTLVKEAIEEIHYRGDRAVAIFHSHPTSSANPSDADKEMMQQADDTVFMILGTDRLSAYMWEDGEAKEIARTRLE
jgi:proteasome lid subunit RPN8/RPN11